MRTKSAAVRGRIVEAAYEAFWRAGYARSSIDTIATLAGVTKRTLYGHFRSKDDLLACVLERYADFAGARWDRIGARMPQSCEGVIDSLFGQLADWAHSTPRWSGSGLTRLVMELGDLPGHPARSIARHAKTTAEAWLAGRFLALGLAGAEARARETVLLMEGAMALTLIHGGRAYLDAAAQAAKRLLTAAPTDAPSGPSR